MTPYAFFTWWTAAVVAGLVVMAAHQEYRKRAADRARAARQDPPPAFVCPTCGARSWHPEDGRHGYCGRCKAFTGRPAGLDIPTDPDRGAA